MSDPAMADVQRRLAAIERWQDTMAQNEVPRFIGATYATDAGQTFTNGAAAAVVNFEDLVYDPQSLVTTGAGWVFTCPIAGLYVVTASILFSGSTGWALTERGLLECFKNGSLAYDLDRKDNFASGGSSLLMRLQGTCAVLCAAGDTLDIRATQNSGGNLTILNQANWNYVNVLWAG